MHSVLSPALFHNCIDIVRIQDSRFLADHIRTEPEPVPHVGIMKIVRGTYRKNLYLPPGPLELCTVTVEKFLFGKKAASGK